MSKGVKIQIETLYLKAFFLNVGKYIEIINYYLSQKNEALPLGNYIKIFGGFAFKSTGYQKEGIPIIRISDFQNEQIFLEHCKKYKEDSILEKYELKIGDIIIALTGGTIGKLAIVQEGLGRIYMNQRVGRFDILNPELFEKEYAYWIARGVQEKIKNLAWGGAQPNVSGKQIENMEFPIPEKSIQKKIIQFLNDLKNNSIKDSVYFDRECEKEIIRLQNKQIALFQIKENTNTEEELLKILRQQILQDAILGKLTAGWRAKNPDIEPASKLLEKIKAEKEKLIAEKKIKKEKPLPEIEEDEMPFELPEKWQWCCIESVCEIKGGKRVPKNYSLSKKPTEHVYIRILDMKEGGINENNLAYISNEVFEIIKHYTISSDDLYVTIAGTIGQVGIIPESLSGANLTENAAKLCNIGIDKDFLKYSVESLIVQNQFKEKRKGAAQPKLALKRIANTIFPLPPLAEQKAIVTKIEKLMEHISKLEEKIKQNKQDAEMLMQSFLVEAFKN